MLQHYLMHVFPNRFKAQVVAVSRLAAIRYKHAFDQRHGYSYSQIKLMDARTRWGSCGPRGTINLSWRLVMAPVRVIDYVVTHELVHLQERNHSKAYWERVKLIMPDFAQQVDWLERNGHKLTITS